MLQIRFMSSSSEIPLTCIPLNTFDDMSTLVQAWCYRNSVDQDLCHHMNFHLFLSYDYENNATSHDHIFFHLNFNSFAFLWRINKFSLILDYDNVTGARFMLQLESLFFYSFLTLPLWQQFCMHLCLHLFLFHILQHIADTLSLTLIRRLSA